MTLILAKIVRVVPANGKSPKSYELQPLAPVAIRSFLPEEQAKADWLKLTEGMK